MNKFELARYLADLMVVSDYLSDTGVEHTWLTGEMNSVIGDLQKEVEDETRQSEPRRSGVEEDGTEDTSSQSWRR